MCVWIYIYVVDVKRGKMQMGKNELCMISVLGLGSRQVLSASRRESGGAFTCTATHCGGVGIRPSFDTNTCIRYTDRALSSGKVS